MSGSVAETAINVTICGLAIVFGTLISLVIIISIFGLIMSSIQKANAKRKENAAAKAAAAKTAPAANVQTAVAAAPSAPAASMLAGDDSDELVAVISAAVAAMYSDSGKTYAVRNIRPVNTGARSVWAAAGIARNTRSF